jgi:methylated-DNA-[protein]-cysteine S-methyltransferase
MNNVSSWQESMNTDKKEEKMPNFAEKAYELLRQVPKGRVTTYKEIAHALGSRSYRGVGQAMKNNPYAPEVP